MIVTELWLAYNDGRNVLRIVLREILFVVELVGVFVIVRTQNVSAVFAMLAKLSAQLVDVKQAFFDKLILVHLALLLRAFLLLKPFLHCFQPFEAACTLRLVVPLRT